MDISEEMREFIKKEIEFVETMPERYRDSTFEFILRTETQGFVLEESIRYPEITSEIGDIIPHKKTIPFLGNFDIRVEKLDHLFIFEENEIIPIYSCEFKESTEADVYADYRCLLVLKNTVSDSFSSL